MKTVHFIHDVGGSPWDEQVTFFANIARTQGFQVESLDYTDLSSGMDMVKRLNKNYSQNRPDVLVGFGMGAWAANAFSSVTIIQGLFLFSPAFSSNPEKNHYPAHADGGPVELAHGWNDLVTPYENSVAFAKSWGCTLHLLKDDHLFSEQKSRVGEIFSTFLRRFV